VPGPKVEKSRSAIILRVGLVDERSPTRDERVERGDIGIIGNANNHNGRSVRQ
jgi:hypothetical protein